MKTNKVPLANETQVGGTHYKKGGEEHWDRQWRLYGRGYFVGCITKYVERYHEKDGIKDLRKAAHFIQKLIELETISLSPRAEAETASPHPGFFFNAAVADFDDEDELSNPGPGYIDQD